MTHDHDHDHGHDGDDDRDRHPSRRTFLRAAVAAAALPAASLAARPVRGSETPDLNAWFENTDNATELVDRRGESSVTVSVGAAANGGALGFEPAAVRVDPGTTVVWEWTGKGGVHNVVAEDGTFQSEYLSDAGATFEYAPDAAGVHTYACAPHKTMGMKGALVVGDDAVTFGEGVSTGRPEGLTTFDGWLADTTNYDAIVDLRGEERVTVEVGAEGNGGAFAFEPAAIHVDPGTEVVWEWVGDKTYDVLDESMGYRSETVGGAGYRYGVQFDGHGVSKYACEQYAEFGMKGVVVIGEGEVDGLTTAQVAVGGAGLGVLAAPLAGLTYLHYRNTTGGHE